MLFRWNLSYSGKSLTSTTQDSKTCLVFNMDKSSKFIFMAKRVAKTVLQKRETQGSATREQAAATHSNSASTLRSMRMAEGLRPHELLCRNGTLSTLGEIGGGLWQDDERVPYQRQHSSLQGSWSQQEVHKLTLSAHANFAIKSSITHPLKWCYETSHVDVLISAAVKIAIYRQIRRVWIEMSWLRW